MASSLAYYGLVAYRALSGHWKLSCVQATCLVFYIAAIVMASLAALLTASNQTNPALVETTRVLWLVAVPLVVAAASFVLVREGKALANGRGYSQPKVLVRTTQGWDLSPWQESEQLWLLGVVRRKPIALNTLRGDSFRLMATHSRVHMHGTPRTTRPPSFRVAKEVELVATHV